MQIRTDAAIGSTVIFDGSRKLAVVNTHNHAGLFRNGVAVYELLPRSSWTVHFCSPVMHLDEVQAVLDALPKE